MPSFFSGAPKLTPGSDFSTTNAEMPRLPASGSVTAKTVEYSDTPAFVIHRLTPLSPQWSPSRTARVVIDAASLPASGSDRQYENIASPAATGVRYRCFSSAEPASSSGKVPSLFTAGISDEAAQARAT